ncbi:MAG: pyridoxamine 5'-phosphate oxidase family protein [Proteobacteria bacterium]|nr:pyridoxamine 5'-phosphate oxidase family protein [Pseudomonadota bacterium]
MPPKAWGGPWAAAVFYANDGFSLYFLSSATSRHVRDIAAQATVAATIQEDYADWREIKGIQLEGTVQQLEGVDEIGARKLYAQKYPVIADIDSAPAAIAAALATVRWYRLIPAKVFFVDNSTRFGHRDQVL